MTKGTFGESLKREREMRGVTLEEISAATRIATRFLRAIENEEWEQLPGGVFNRGFVRAVARYLGLDEENTVSEYALAVGDRPSVPVWTGSPPLVAPEQHYLAWIVAAVLLLVLLAAAWFGTRRFLAWRAARRSAQAAVVIDAPSPELANSPQRTAARLVSADVEQISYPVPETQVADSAPAAIAPAPQADQTLELKMEAIKKTSATVVADKEVVFDGPIKVNEMHSYSATDHFQVSADDAGALHLELNGATVASMGNPGTPGKITLTRHSLAVAAGGTN
jgi:cytoskeleton protein RodZ